MMSHSDFSELYRNALAERDPQQKNVLLHLVAEALEQWRHNLAGSVDRTLTNDFQCSRDETSITDQWSTH